MKFDFSTNVLVTKRMSIVTAIKGMTTERFNMIPFRFWVVEYLRLMFETWVGILMLIFLTPKEVFKNFTGFIGAFLVILLFSTVFAFLGPWLIKLIIKEDCEEKGVFVIHSRYFSNKITTFAFLTGALVRDFDLSDESQLDEFRWFVQGLNF